MGMVTQRQGSICCFLLLATIFSHAGEVPFSWESCSKPSDPVKITSLNVRQNSTKSVYVTGNGKVGYNLTSPIKGDVKVWRKTVFGWLAIPCVDNFGSCTYEDVCLLSPYAKECPEEYRRQNLPCSCPVPQGRYSVQDLPVDIHFLPNWLEKGLYKVRALLTWNDKELICIKMTMELL